MNDDKVRLASVGLGWWGSELAKAVSGTGRAEIVTCFARSEEGRERFAAEHGCRTAGSLEELLADPEVEGVVIATSNQSHRPLVEQAAAAGKHVFVEKPFTNTVEDGVASVAAAREAGVLIQVGHQRRRTAAKRRIKAMLEAGELGDVETVVAHQSIPNGFKMPDEAWRWDPEQSPLGSMTSLGVHKIDTMHYLVGPIRNVFAFTRPGRSHPIDEATILAMEFDSGALATLTTSFFTPVINEIAVFGTGGAAYSSGGGARLKVQGRDDPGPEEVDLEPIDPVVDQMADFARAIRGEIPVEVDGEAGLAVIAVLEAAVLSVAERRPVEVARV
ncbi:MAG TPA: Gfo/Idh/MocA family oxidoreductase [Acidimicrobiia bacterium]|nr:Gfo/Idh/MocA family oxidoreductase [Acidimicrobiia bacterium]